MIQIVCRPQRVMRKETQWSMVSVVPSSLHFTLLWLKQNHTLFPEDLLFDHMSTTVLRYFCYRNTAI